MAKTKVVTSRKADGGTVYDFRCPYPTGCGGADQDGKHAPWHSVGWASHDLAVDRGKEHIREHETGADPDVETVLTPSLAQFFEAHGITQATAGETGKPDNWEF